MSKYEVICGPYFPVFGLNTGKYGPEITPYLDAFHAVLGQLFATDKWNIDHLSDEELLRINNSIKGQHNSS